MQYTSPWLQWMSVAGRMVGLMGSLLAPRGAPRTSSLAGERLAPPAEPWPAFAETQPMCFEARRPEAAPGSRPPAPR